MSITGTDNFDIALGTNASEEIRALGGDDSIYGADGDDEIFAGAGDDEIFEGFQTWIWVGGSSGYQTGVQYDFGRGNDYIDGGSGIDTLYYGALSNEITYDVTAGEIHVADEVDRIVRIERVFLGAGDDRVLGMHFGGLVHAGDGFDLLDLRTETSRIRIDLSDRASSVGRREANIDGFEEIRGSLSQQNTLLGNHQDNTLLGGERKDQLEGLGGNDRLNGRDGDDRLDGGTGEDWLEGGAGHDRITSGDGNDTVYGGADHDMINGDAGDDRLYGGDGDDVISAGYGNDFVQAGDGNDQIYAVSGFNILHGGAGDDTFFGMLSPFDEANNTEFYGGAGDDVLDGGRQRRGILSGGAGDDEITGGGPRTLRLGGAGNDTIQGEGDGGAGDDYIYDVYSGEAFGRRGDDTLSVNFATGYGGAGNDIISIRAGGTAFGGSGRDEFTLERTHGVIFADGGRGYDIAHVLTSRPLFLRDDDSVDAPNRHTVLQGFEEILFNEWSTETFAIHASDVKVTILDGQHELVLTGDNVRLSGSSFGHQLTMENSDGSIVRLGDGADTVTVERSASLLNLGGGDDTAVVSGAIELRAGGGADLIEIGGAGASRKASIDAGAGDDVVNIYSRVGFVALGRGDDLVRVKAEASGSQIAGGNGADTFRFAKDLSGGTYTLTDFEIGADRLDIPDLTALSDLSAIESFSEGVRLVSDLEEGGTIAIRLLGLTQAELSDAILV